MDSTEQTNDLNQANLITRKEEVLQNLVTEGEDCNRLLQNFVKSFKVRITLRKTFNIQ